MGRQKKKKQMKLKHQMFNFVLKTMTGKWSRQSKLLACHSCQNPEFGAICRFLFYSLTHSLVHPISKHLSSTKALVKQGLQACHCLGNSHWSVEAEL